MGAFMVFTSVTDILITWSLSLTQFHLPCIGIAIARKGEWYCEECLAKRGAQTSTKSHRRGGHVHSNSTAAATNSNRSGNGRGGSGGGRRTKSSNNRSGNNGRAKSQSATVTSSSGANNGAASEPGASNGLDGPGVDGTPSSVEGLLSNARVKDE